MKINGFLIVGIMLTILTIGAASASENMTSYDAVAVVSDSSGDLVGESYYDDDFYITVQENYTQDLNDWSSTDIIYISSYSQNNGTISILVDDVEKQSLDITNGYFSVEDDGYGGTYEKYFKQIYPEDLGLDLGNYNVKVNYNQKTLIDASVSLKEKEDFDIYLSNPYYCEIDYWSSPSFIVIDSNHLNTGTLEILVNGTRKVSYAVTNGSFEEIEDCSSKSRYLAASDLMDGYGTYNIKIIFTQDGTAKTLKDENVVVAEFEPTTDPKLELYFDLYTVNLPADDIAHIYLPREATGTLTISYNNVINHTVDYSKGYATHYMHSWDMNHLGENIVTVTYTGDDFGTLTATETVIVIPTITAPAYISTGENFTITMCTHEWVNGNFNVYEYNNGKKGKLLASNIISNRYSSVEISSNTVGLNQFYLEFDYIGGDYPLIQDVYVIENSQNITVDVSSEIETESDVNITFNAPESPFTFVYISVDGNAPYYYMVEKGQFTTAISNLSVGYHTISLQYNDGSYVDGKLVGEVYSNTFTVNVGAETSIEANDVNMDYNSSENLVMKLKDNEGNVLVGKDIVINLNELNHTLTTDNNGQATLTIDLVPGSYSAVILFAGDNGYLSSSAIVNVIVNKIASELSADDVSVVYGDAANLVICLKDADGNVLADKEILINLAGSSLKQKTDSKGQVSLPINLACGNYSAKIDFYEDDCYKASSTNAEIAVNRITTQLMVSDISTTYNVAKNLVVTLKDDKGNVLAGQNVIIKLNNKIYNKSTDENGQVILSVSLSANEYIANITFEGSDIYKSSTQSANVIVKKATTKLAASSKTFKVKPKTKKVTVKLKNNKGKAIKKATVKLTVNKKTYKAKTDSNGIATFKVKLTKKGKYNAVYKYEGSSNYKSATKKVKITIK